MRRRIAFALALALAGCGGGGGSTVIPTATSTPPHSSQSVKVKLALVIPVAQSSSTSRKPAFISAAAKGVLVNVTGSHGGTGSAVADISAGSTTCMTSRGQRTCDVNVTAPFDTDAFSITLFDTAPAGTTIPSTAHVLGTGSVTQTITSTFSGAISLFVGGQVSTIGLGSTFVSADADGGAQTIGITIAPTDFGNTPIVAGANDPYSNPITVTLAENGGSGHMHLVLNGNASGTSATLKQSSDTISVAYDGGGSSGYNAVVTLSASGAASETMQISPMFITSTSPLYSDEEASLNGSVTTLPITVSEANAPNTLSYTITASGCSNVASLSTVTQSSGTANFSITGGSVASASGCIITLDDGITSCIIDVQNSPSGGTLPLPGWSIQEFQAKPTPGASAPASPGALALGPDGRMWFTDVLNGGVGAMTTTGAVTNYTSAIFYGTLFAAPNGNIWATEGSKIDELSTSGSVVKQISTQFPSGAMAQGPDGNIWLTEGYFNGPAAIAQISSSGAVIQELLVSVAASPDVAGITSAPDHTMWFCDNNNSQIDNVMTSSPYTVSTVLSLGGTGCENLATGNDGNVWVTGNSAGVLVVNPTSKTIVHTIPLSNTLSSLSSIVQGADGAMYLTEDSANVIARIDETTYTPTEFAAPTASAFVRGIATGADGRIWFSENNVNQLGALTP